MYLQGKYIYDLTSDDIESLFKNQVRESKSLDYKRELDITGANKDKNRLEFFCDIASFYNTEGGVLLYGIEERRDPNGNTGYPEKYFSQNMPNEDQIEQQINSIIRSNTDPEITNIAIKFIDVQENKLLAIGIPRGLGLPSMVTNNDHNKFYRRNSTGKYAVGTAELNQMFMQNQLVKDKAEEFRKIRIKEVRNDGVIPLVDKKGSYFLHIIPYSFLQEKIINLGDVSVHEKELNIFPIRLPLIDNNTGYNITFNLDGLMTYRTDRINNFITAFNQYFRNGAVELYSKSFIYKHEQQKYLFGNELVEETCATIFRSLPFLKYLGIDPPLIIGISLLDTSNAAIFDRKTNSFNGKFTRDSVILPLAIIPRYDLTALGIFELLKLHFDIIWQAAGQQSCPAASHFFSIKGS